MKKLLSLIALSMTLVIAFASCAPQGSPSPTPTPGATTSATASATSGVEQVGLTPPDVGSTMQWVDGSTLVYVPAGDFIMGTNGGKDNPQHTVTLDGFWIYQSKVTNREYALCVGVGKCQPPLDPQAAKDLSDPTLLEHPVVGVNWSQSQTYCGWVQGRLPTEAQWEKTARGTQGNPYPWGAAEPDNTLLNFNDNVGTTSKITDFTKGQSYYTAFDMEGNVFEWVADWYKADYYATSPQKNPLGPDTGDLRSMRSSSFSSTPDQVPAYTRFSFKPDKIRPDLGFRCVIAQPAAFAAYCQTSQVAGPPTCQPPTVSRNPFCRGGTTSGNVIKISGGTIQSATGTKPLQCAPINGQEIYCQGPSSSYTGTLTLCTVGCGNGPLSCPAGYHPVVTRDGPTCEHDPVSILPAGPGQSGNTGTNTISQGNLPVLCIFGTYYDKATNTCKPVSNGTPNQCIPGYALNQGCCQAPTGGQYPGCRPNEYFDPASQSCVPNGQPGAGSCETISITTGVCSTKSGGGCQPPAAGCPVNPLTGQKEHWDPASCSCK